MMLSLSQSELITNFSYFLCVTAVITLLATVLILFFINCYRIWYCLRHPISNQLFLSYISGKDIWTLLYLTRLEIKFIDKVCGNNNWRYLQLSTVPISMNALEHIHDKSLDWELVTLNPKLTIDFIRNHSDKNWSYKFLYYNTSIDWKDITKLIDEVSTHSYIGVTLFKSDNL